MKSEDYLGLVERNILPSGDRPVVTNKLCVICFVQVTSVCIVICGDIYTLIQRFFK